MEMKLTVLAGAKQGTSIPLKKDEFVIGRSSECTLRAGSDAISRRHCLIERTDDGFAVRDLGSRNGTFLNNELVKEATILREGDELRIGPLTFRIDPAKTKQKAPVEAEVAETAVPVEATAGLKKSKQPPVKNVADVAARVAGNGHGDDMEDDISRWLIHAEVPSSPSTSETVNFKVGETRAMKREEVHSVVEEQAPEAPAEESDEIQSDEVIAEEEASDKSSGSGWSLFGRGKKGKESTSRPKPGKLPNRPDKDQAKDSREAAANVLREMTRRR